MTNKVLIFLIALFIFSCKTQHNNQANKGSLLMEMNKTGCMGSCPVYQFSVYDGGMAKLNAEKNFSLQGKYTTKLDQRQINEIIRTFKAYNFFNYNTKYSSRSLDLPTTTLYFAHEGNEKKVVDYDQAPESLKELEVKMENMIKEFEWKKTN